MITDIHVKLRAQETRGLREMCFEPQEVKNEDEDEEDEAGSEGSSSVG